MFTAFAGTVFTIKYGVSCLYCCMFCEVQLSLVSGCCELISVQASTHASLMYKKCVGARALVSAQIVKRIYILLWGLSSLLLIARTYIGCK